MLVTYLDENDTYRFMDIEHEELQELLDEANSGDDYFVVEPMRTRRLFRKPIIRYYLYGRLSKCEFQLINIGNTMEAVKAYLYGYLNGLKRK